MNENIPVVWHRWKAAGRDGPLVERAVSFFIAADVEIITRSANLCRVMRDPCQPRPVHLLLSDFYDEIFI